MIDHTDHLHIRGEKMVIKLKNVKRMILTLSVILYFGGCSTTPPRQPTIEPVERDAIKAALKQDIRPQPPGPPPFSHKIMPKTVKLDLPETLFSMTLNRVPLSAAIEAIMQDSQLNQRHCT